MLVATRLTSVGEVVAVTTKEQLVSGQELGQRLAQQELWRRNYLVDLGRLRRLDAVRRVCGRATHVDPALRTVTVALADGTTSSEPYDALVIATGVGNGFWRDDVVRDTAGVDAALEAEQGRVEAARCIAVVGGGASGVSAAVNLAKAHPEKRLHLFFSGDEPLPAHHPRVRSRIRREILRAGVAIYPGHRAVLPQAFEEGLGVGPVQWTTGQPPFDPDLVLWTVGHIRPHSGFLPADMLTEHKFVRVDEHMQVPGHANVFAVGDVAATDPLRSSARNDGHVVVAHNVRARLAERRKGLRRFRYAKWRWGSVLGLQEDGILIFAPNGWAFRVARVLVQPLLFSFFVEWMLYGGVRGQAH